MVKSLCRVHDKVSALRPADSGRCERSAVRPCPDTGSACVWTPPRAQVTGVAAGAMLLSLSQLKSLGQSGSLTVCLSDCLFDSLSV